NRVSSAGSNRSMFRSGDCQYSGICFIQWPDTLRADALPPFVPILAPPVLHRWTQLYKVACTSDPLGESLHGISATFIGIECEKNGLYLLGEPIWLGSSADQRYYSCLTKACCQQC